MLHLIHVNLTTVHRAMLTKAEIRDTPLGNLCFKQHAYKPQRGLVTFADKTEERLEVIAERYPWVNTICQIDKEMKKHTIAVMFTVY